MEERTRDTWDRRTTERRQTGKIIKLTDSNFENEMINIPVFGLAQFSCHWSQPCKKQEDVLRQIAQDFKHTERLRVGLFEASPKNALIPSKYGIVIIPTLMLFREGEVIYRNNGYESRVPLKKKIDRFISTDRKLFIERRHDAEKREGQRRRSEPMQTIIWRDLKNELATTPWPVVLSINPEDPVLNDKFSSLVESVIQKLETTGLRALHVTGTPAKQVKRHFGITVDAPAVAVFFEGKLIDQFENLRSRVNLSRRLRRALP
jgi:thioredoxin 1